MGEFEQQFIEMFVQRCPHCKENIANKNQSLEQGNSVTPISNNRLAYKLLMHWSADFLKEVCAQNVPMY